MESRLFIRKWGEPTENWQEIGTLVNDTITLCPDENDKDITTGLIFSVSIPSTRKHRCILAKAFGLMKSPKCTYRTIRRDCAKRNRYR